MEIFEAYGIIAQESAPMIAALRQRPARWVDLMVGLEKPDPKRALASALTIGGAYIVGGSIPLSPYIVLPSAQTALLVSVVVTLVGLFVFGAFKGHFTGTPPCAAAFRRW